MEIGIVIWVLIMVVSIGAFIGILCMEANEEKQRRKEVDLAAEKERRRENRDKYRYKTARVMERGQKRQHQYERESQYPARPKLPPRQTRPALPAPEDDE